VKLLAGVGLGRGSKALIALLGVLALVTPVLALLRGALPLPLIPLLLAGSWIIAYLLVDRFILRVLRGAVRIIEDSLPPFIALAPPGGSEDIGEPPVEEGGREAYGVADFYDDSYEIDINEAMLLAWGLAKSLVGEIAGRSWSVYVAAHDGGVIYYVYPENYGEDVYKLVDEDVLEDITVARAGEKSYLVILSEDVVETLYHMAMEGSGERLVVETRDQLELVYRLAKSIAKAHLGNPPEAYIDYVAYKTVVKLALKDIIKAPQEMLDKIPDIDSDTMKRIKRQVDEELGGLGTGSTSPSTA